MERPSLEQALQKRDSVMRAFVTPDGRISHLPVKQAKRLVVLDHVAQAFDVGRHYPEPVVNEMLRLFTTTTRRCAGRWSTRVSSNARTASTGAAAERSADSPVEPLLSHGRAATF